MAKGIDTRLESIAHEIERAAGDNLVSLLVRGSAVRGDFDGKRSDLNLVLILRDTSAQALRPLGKVVGKWVKSGQPTPVIFSENGWKDSTDVFPIELEDMREAHGLLRGTDPFEGIRTEMRHVRHELEREARGKLIQLRAEYVAVESNGKWLGGLLLSSAKTFFVLFRALVRCKGEPVPADNRALVAAAAEIAGFDANAFEWLLAKMAGEKRSDLTAYDQTGAQYLQAIERLVDYVDKMETKETTE